MQSGRQQSSRATAGASRTGSGRQSAAQQAAASSPPDESSSDDSDSDSDDNEPEGAVGQAQGQQPSAQGIDDVKRGIYAAFAAFNEDGLSPRTFTSTSQPHWSRQTQFARMMAGGFSRLVRADTDLATLQGWIRVPGPEWSAQLAGNLNRRLRAITEGLELNRRGGGGQDVIRTVDAFYGLFVTVDEIRAEHFTGMVPASRDYFVALLVTILEIIINRNEDLYTNINRPAYAGEATRNERRLFACWLAVQSQPAGFLSLLARCAGHLQQSGPRLRTLCRTVQGYQANGIVGVANPVLRLQWLWDTLDALARGKLAESRWAVLISDLHH